MSSTTIQSVKLQGHQGPVLCLDVQDDCLLSGSEDGTARLWDLRESSSNKRRASLCIRTQGEVLSAVFAPRRRQQQQQAEEESQNNNNNNNIDSTTITIGNSSPFAKNHTIFLSVENQVAEYDLRQANGPIVVEPTSLLSPILQNQDEVNQLALTYFVPSSSKKGGGGKRKGKKASNHNNIQQQQEPILYVAAADDAGKVRCMQHSSSSTTTMCDILHHDPNGVAVVPTCAFRPMITKTKKKGGASLELASGGTDCKIHLWDLQRPKKPISSYTIQMQGAVEDGNNASNNRPQVCNPPMVHSLAWSPSGQLLAAGLGDGTIPLWNVVENRQLVQVGLLPDGHASSVASIVFPTFGNHFNKDNSNNNATNNTGDRLLLSGGSDGSVLCWDVGANSLLLQDGFGDDSDNMNVDQDPSSFFPESLLTGTHNNSNNTTAITFNRDVVMEDATTAGLMDSLSLLQMTSRPKILFGIPHGPKVNWMTTMAEPATIFVADTTNDITAYYIPTRT